MIFISVDRIPVTVKNKIEIKAIIKNYGEGELNIPELFWRKNKHAQWRKTKMAKSGTPDLFTAGLKKSNPSVEYYIKASSTKGKSLQMPISAPDGYYNYSQLK